MEYPAGSNRAASCLPAALNPAPPLIFNITSLDRKPYRVKMVQNGAGILLVWWRSYSGNILRL